MEGIKTYILCIYFYNCVYCLFLCCVLRIPVEPVWSDCITEVFVMQVCYWSTQQLQYVVWYSCWSMANRFCSSAFWPVASFPLCVSVAWSNWHWTQDGHHWHSLSGFAVSSPWCVLYHTVCTWILLKLFNKGFLRVQQIFILLLCFLVFL